MKGGSLLRNYRKSHLILQECPRNDVTYEAYLCIALAQWLVSRSSLPGGGPLPPLAGSRTEASEQHRSYRDGPIHPVLLDPRR